jgi:hypothetical protein
MIHTDEMPDETGLMSPVCRTFEGHLVTLEVSNAGTDESAHTTEGNQRLPSNGRTP